MRDEAVQKYNPIVTYVEEESNIGCGLYNFQVCPDDKSIFHIKIETIRKERYKIETSCKDIPYLIEGRLSDENVRKKICKYFNTDNLDACLIRIDQAISELKRQYQKYENEKEAEKIIETAADYAPEEIDKALSKFKNTTLLYDVREEIDKDHVGDEKAKLLLFCSYITALQDKKYRISVRLAGDSSAGKDSLNDACAKHLPERCYRKFTSTSDKFLLRAFLDVNALYLSELNLKKENGNNANIVEVIKAYSEGGVDYAFLDKAIEGGFEEKINHADKKVIVYSSTDIGTDDELANRFITISVDGSREQTQKVLDRIYDHASEIGRHEEEKNSWIRIGLSQLKPFEIFIPYARIFKKYTDVNDTRARRDAKRFLNIIKSITFLHQLQRLRVKRNGKEYLTADYNDLSLALQIIGDVLNQSYTTIEPRLQKVLDEVRKYSDWVQRSEIVKALNLKGKKKPWEVFSELRNQNLIEERPKEDDKRIKEVRATNRNVNPFLNTEDKNILADCIMEFKKWFDENSSVILPGNKETYFQDLAQISQHIAYNEEERISEWVSADSDGKPYFYEFENRFQKRKLLKPDLESIKNADNQENEPKIHIIENNKEIGIIVSEVKDDKKIDDINPEIVVLEKIKEIKKMGNIPSSLEIKAHCSNNGFPDEIIEKAFETLRKKGRIFLKNSTEWCLI